MKDLTIKNIHAREILDSRGNPTVQAEITLSNGTKGSASVPSGASTGKNEALELRDGDPGYYQGKGVQNACSNIEKVIGPALEGRCVCRQQKLDRIMLELDGTENKHKLGANAILAVSLAAARTASLALKVPLYRYIGGIQARNMPVPMMNVINAGVHAETPVDFQEFMIRPVHASSFREALRCGAEIFQTLKGLLQKQGLSTSCGDEGGFAPRLSTPESILDLMMESVEAAGYDPGRDAMFAIDCAASEFYSRKTRTYQYKKSGMASKTSEEQADYLVHLTEMYPIDSIEDGMAESDWDGWALLTGRIGDRVQLVGDDLLTTNVKYLKKAVQMGAANAILIKMNQIGTLSETLQTVETARDAGYRTIISHRSGETEDTFIADLAVAVNAGQIKTGSLSRSERLCKYNRLLEIEDELDRFPL